MYITCVDFTRGSFDYKKLCSYYVTLHLRNYYVRNYRYYRKMYFLCKQYINFVECVCPCHRLASQNFIKDPTVLQKRIKELKRTLAVNRSKLSSFVRRKTTSADNRISSKAIGFAFVGVVTFILTSVVCSDLFLLIAN